MSKQMLSPGECREAWCPREWIREHQTMAPTLLLKPTQYLRHDQSISRLFDELGLNHFTLGTAGVEGQDWAELAPGELDFWLLKLRGTNQRLRLFRLRCYDSDDAPSGIHRPTRRIGSKYAEFREAFWQDEEVNLVLNWLGYPIPVLGTYSLMRLRALIFLDQPFSEPQEGLNP
ncbi:MAG: hypothetical protein V1821_01000 [bacterium]